MNKRAKFLIACGIILTAGLVWAAKDNSLYQASLLVTSQSMQERNQVLEKGLAQVIIKVSGNSQALQNPNLKANLPSADSLMEAFSYSPSGNEAKPFLLHMDFDPEGINKLLRAAGLPIWGQNRPLILVWLEYEPSGQTPEIISNDSAPAVSSLFKNKMDERGIPIIFPMMDMTDINQVSANDIVTMNLPALNIAARRYSSDALLIGRIVQNATGFTTQWKLLLGNEQWTWDVTEKTLAESFTRVTNHISDTLSKRFAVVVTNTVQEKVTLKIVGVDQSDDFTQLMNYIKHLTLVADAQTLQVDGDEIVLSISLRGPIASFTQALTVGQKLIPIPENNDPEVLLYRWNH